MFQHQHPGGKETLLNPTPDVIQKSIERLDKKKDRDRIYAQKTKEKKSEYDRERYLSTVH